MARDLLPLIEDLGMKACVAAKSRGRKGCIEAAFRVACCHPFPCRVDLVSGDVVRACRACWDRWGQACSHGTAAEAVELQLEIEAIEKRAGKASPVTLSLQWRAAARMIRIAKPSTGAGVGGRHQRESTGEGALQAGSADPQHAFLKGLAQLIEDPPWKFRQFIEKQHASVGQAEFAGARKGSTAEQSRR